MNWVGTIIGWRGTTKTQVELCREASEGKEVSRRKPQEDAIREEGATAWWDSERRK